MLLLAAGRARCPGRRPRRGVPHFLGPGMFGDVVGRGAGSILRWNAVRALGADELQYTKGHKYLRLVHRIDEGIIRLLWVGRESTAAKGVELGADRARESGRQRRTRRRLPVRAGPSADEVILLRNIPRSPPLQQPSNSPSWRLGCGWTTPFRPRRLSSACTTMRNSLKSRG